MEQSPEIERLQHYHEKKSNWKKWGPYLSERAWGTVREDYSREGEAWGYLTHDQARSKAYRWNEDGIGGISDRDQKICFALALWNGKDPILKERFFGLNNYEGNHGEDVKDYYYYLDSTPTHSYMKMLYKYPLQEFPYQKMIDENKKRGYREPEYELVDTGIFDKQEYLDVFIEYAKESPEDVLIKITVINRSDREAHYTLLPTVWFRNTWSWGYPKGPMEDMEEKPFLKKARDPFSGVELTLGKKIYSLTTETDVEWIFTENITNNEKLYHTANKTPYVKDAFHRYLIDKDQSAINPQQEGTKAACIYRQTIEPKGQQVFKLRLKNEKPSLYAFENFDNVFKTRKEEADQYYQSIQNPRLNQEQKILQRSALAGMLWSKQLYYYDVRQWLKGDPIYPLNRDHRLKYRNKDWHHLVNFDVISMPDKWEYPWYASWDLAFHCLPLVLVDPDFAKRQLTLMTREWYQHPNGQVPSYEWNFCDVTPPVHAWSAWRTYKIEGKMYGNFDKEFLIGIYNKLLLNFTWWINRKDRHGKNVFQGGFMGMDNISLFDRSSLPFGGWIDQADATAWMGFYCIAMLKISLELAKDDPIYQDMATKFFEHFLRIATAMTQAQEDNPSLWEREDGFFYDVLHSPDGKAHHLKVRSLVGLLPLLSVDTFEEEELQRMPTFNRRMEWFLSKRPELSRNVTCLHAQGVGKKRMISFVSRGMLISILRYMLDEKEFLSDYGIRSLSKYHLAHPIKHQIDGTEFSVSYQPGDSENELFGGNSNWRGPIWFPINFLIIEALQKFHHYYGDSLKVEFPTGSGNLKNLGEIAKEISKRLTQLFLTNDQGFRPIYGKCELFQKDPHWKDHFLFFEYFHGDTGQGLGASHQTGWTGLIAKLLQQYDNY